MLNLRNPNLRSAHKNFMLGYALRHLLTILSLSAPCAHVVLSKHVGKFLVSNMGVYSNKSMGEGVGHDKDF